VTLTAPYEPITPSGRAQWFVRSTVGPRSLAAGVVKAGWGTAFNNPEEYGPHWSGYAKRFGMRLTGVATSNAIEAGLGSAWGEDPRYFPTSGTVWQRIGHAATMSVLAYRSDGSRAPAYARYAAIAGSNFLSNTWRVESDSTTNAALSRIAMGFGGKFVGRLITEFWPGFRHGVLRK
jgi:hypothetical protein